MDRPVSQHGASKDKLDFKKSHHQHIRMQLRTGQNSLCVLFAVRCVVLKLLIQNFAPAAEGNELVKG